MPTRSRCWPWAHQWRYSRYEVLGNVKHVKRCIMCGRWKDIE